MVIHKFNKLIRNKWLWGAFAVAISAAFCFDDLFTSRGPEERSVGGAGTLAGEEVDGKLFLELAEDARGIGRQRDWQRGQGDVNREAWETYAALLVAGRDGLEPTDADVQAAIRADRSFQNNGVFSFALYERLLRDNGVTPERFEAFLKRRMTVQRVAQAVATSAVWTSPMELDQAVSDMTDTFTVKVARFTQTEKERSAVKVDDAALKAWYDKNAKSLALPERIKIRYVRFDATDAKILAKMNVTTNEMHDLYDTTIDRYTSTDTNGVERVKPFDEVKGEIEKELRKIAALQYFETNLNARAYAVKAAKGSSRLDEIAKEDGRKVETSAWFSLAPEYQEGFMVRSHNVCPGAQGFAEAVAELDPSSEDLRYGVVSSDKAVWLIERAETSAAHTPAFSEAKDAIRPRALRDARAEAFKAKVEAVMKGGAAAVEKTEGCSTNLTFCVADMRGQSPAFADQYAVARAAMRLKKGEVSEFTLTAPGRALLAVCVDRKPGDAAKAIVIRSQVRDDLAGAQMRQVPQEWLKWNLDRLGFETGEVSSLENPSEDE